MTPTAELPGLARVRDHFLRLLPDRLDTIVTSVETAAQANNPAGIAAALEPAEATLHKIAGAAGSLQLRQLGDRAREAEFRVAGIRGDCAGGRPADPARLDGAILALLDAAAAI